MNNATSDLLRLPTLDNLKGFAAAARHLSFTRAATELCLTQSAVSRQIQTLEGQLGVTLFVRGTRSLTLTPAGENLWRTVDEVLRRLGNAVDSVRGQGRRPVTVSVATGFASLWLMPRLAEFIAAHPEIDTRISANNRVVDLPLEGIDLAIRYAAPDDVPANARLLFAEEVFPVGSAALVGELAQRPPQAADFARLTLLHFDQSGSYPWLGWPLWRERLGVGKAPAKAELHFNLYEQLINAAVAGAGLALARAPLVRDLLADGRLVPLATPPLQVAERATYMLTLPGGERPEVNILRDWLLAQSAGERESGG